MHYYGVLHYIHILGGNYAQVHSNCYLKNVQGSEGSGECSVEHYEDLNIYLSPSVLIHHGWKSKEGIVQ